MRVILVLFKVVRLLIVVHFLCQQLNILFTFWIKVNISFLFWFVRALTRLCNHIYTVHPHIVLRWGPVYSLFGSKSDCFDVLGKFDFIIRWCAFVCMCVGGEGKAGQGNTIYQRALSQVSRTNYALILHFNSASFHIIFRRMFFFICSDLISLKCIAEATITD